MLIRGIYGVVYSTIIIGMFRYIIIIIYEVPTDARGFTAGQKNCGKSGLGRPRAVGR